MSTDTKEVTHYNKSALEFKSTSFSSPVLVISSADLKQIEHQLDQKISQAPEFFKNSPLLLDILQCNTQELDLDLASLIDCLHSKKLIPIGISGGTEKQNKIALELNIPIHTVRSSNSATNSSPQKLPNPIFDTNEQKETEDSAAPAVENLMLTQPIRSGQRIYSKGDLTIVSHVSAGAEIMAEGHIHVYGSLRGRALAGVQGNISSRIFCSDLQAELVSIAGHYKISEELDKAEHRNPVQIFLEDQKLIIQNT